MSTIITGKGSTFSVTECVDEIWLHVNGKIFDIPLDKAFELSDAIKRAATKCEKLANAVKEANANNPTNIQILGVD